MHDNTGGIMKVEIKYCNAWNFFPEASRVEAELKAKKPDMEISLIKGSGGIFEVKCDGKLVFSKLDHKEHRFPEVGEISSLLKI